MIYVCSDIHGRYDLYLALLAQLLLKPSDTLYILGDVIDRGPDGIKILQDMMKRPNVVPILGNHEFTAAVCLPWLLDEVTEQSLAELDATRWAAIQEQLINGAGPTLRGLKALTQEQRREIIDYIREMELYAEVEVGGRNYVLVHAGLEHFSLGKPLEGYELSDFLFCRPRLGQNYGQDWFIVYGHTPSRLLRQQLGEVPSDGILFRGNQIAVDCGCGFGGPLGCLCLDTLEEIYTTNELKRNERASSP